MSSRKQEDKDRTIFATKEDHEAPSNAELVADDPNDEDDCLILPSGEINWDCPCLGGMASGPCGEQFKAAFSCFHYSVEETRGSECVDEFLSTQECMQRYLDLYPREDDNENPPSQGEGGVADTTRTTDVKLHTGDSNTAPNSAPGLDPLSEDPASTDGTAAS